MHGLNMQDRFKKKEEGWLLSDEVKIYSNIDMMMVC